MSITSLWRRFLSRKKPRQGDAGRRFLERYDTKLHFRELEPRVVLAADVVFDSVSGQMNITLEDGDTIELGSAGGFLTINDLGKVTIDGDDTKALTDINVADIKSLFVSDGVGDSSQLTLLDSLNLLGANGLSVENFEITNIETVIFDGKVAVANDFNLISDADGDIGATFNSVLTVGGSLNVESLTADGKSVTLTSSVTGAVSADALRFQQDAAAGAVIIQLGDGTHDFNTLEVVASVNSQVTLADVDDLNLDGGGTLASLDLTTGDVLTNSATAAWVVSGDTTLDATSITLGQNVGNAHNWNNLNFTATGDVTIVDNVDGLILTGDMSVGGNLVLTAQGDIDQAGGSKLEVTGTTAVTSTGNAVTLTSSDNDFTGAVSVTAKNVSLVDTNDLLLGAITATTLQATAGGEITQNAALNISGATGLNVGAGENLTLTQANTFGGAVAVNAAGPVAGNVQLTGSSAMILGAIKADTLTVRSGGAITQIAGVEVANTATFKVADTKDVTLTNAGNVFGGPVDVTALAQAGNVTLDYAGALELGEIKATNLTVTTTGGITQNGSGIVVSGTTTLTSTGQNITLAETNNDFGGSVNATGADVQLTNTDSIELGDIVATGNLVVTTAAGNGGDITNTAGGDIDVDGNATLTADGSISLADDDQTLDVGGVASFTAVGNIHVGQGVTATANFGSLHFVGTAVSIAESSATALTGNSLATSLSLTSTGDITQVDGKLVVTGAATIATANDKNVTLTQAANDFGGVVNVSGFDVALTDVNKIALGDIQANSLAVIAGGAITQDNSGLQIATTSQFQTANGKDITLDSANNTFGGAVSATGDGGAAGIVTLQNSANLTLGKINATQLLVTADGTIAQTIAGIAVSGTSDFTVADGLTATLDSTNNAMLGAVSIAGAGGAAGNIVLTNNTNLVLGAIDGAELTVTANGTISQTAAVKASGVASFTAANNAAVNLGNTGNTFGDEVHISGKTGAAGNVTLYDTTDLTLGKIDAAQLVVTAEGLIAQTVDGIAVSGTSSFTAADGKNITLDTATNAFQGAISAVGAAGTAADTVTLVNSQSVVLETIKAATLNVTAGGDITQIGGGIDVSGTATLETTLANSTIDLRTAGNTFGTVTINQIDNLLNFHLRNVNAAADIPVGLGPRLASGEMNDVSLLFDNKAGNFTLTKIDISGDLAIETAGNILQSAELLIGGDSSFISGTGKDITLDNAANDFVGGVSVYGQGNTAAGTVTLVDVNDIELALIIATNLSVTAGNAITDDSLTGDLQVANDLTLVAGTVIELANGGGQSLIVSGTASFTAPDGITVGQGAGVAKFGALQFNSSGDVAITEADATQLVDASTAKNLTLISGGTISHGAGAKLTVVEDATLQANAVGSDIALGGLLLEVGQHATFQAANDVTIGTTANANLGSLQFKAGGAVQVTEQSTINLAGDSSSGSLILVAAGDILQDSGKLVVTGTAKLEVQSAGIDRTIDLRGVGNNFGSVEVVSPGALLNFHLRNENVAADIPAGLDVQLASGDMNDVSLLLPNRALDLALPTTVIGGNLVIETGGTISQSGVLVIGGTSQFTSGEGKDVTLNLAGNDFGGAVDIQGQTARAGVVTLVDQNGLVLGSIVAKTLDVTAGGALTHASGGLVDVTTNGTFQATSISLGNDDQDVTIGQHADFKAGSISVGEGTGEASFGTLRFESAGQVTIVETGDTKLTLDNTAGQLALTSTGNLTDLAGTSLIVTGAATLTAAKSITLADTDETLTIGGLATFNGDTGVTLGASGNANFGSLRFNSTGAVNIQEASATHLAGISTANSLVLQSQGNITDAADAKLDITTTATFTTANLIVLADGAGNELLVGGKATFDGTLGINVGAAGKAEFGSLNFTSVQTVAITEADATHLVGANTANTLTLTSGGDLTDAAGASLNVTLNATLSSTGSILLADTNEVLVVGGHAHFQGTVGVDVGSGTAVSLGSLQFNSTGAVTVTESADILLAKSSTAGSLELNANGDITDAAGTSVAVSGDANLIASDAITLAANDQTYTVGGNAKFESTGNKDIQVGVVGGFALDDFTRGADAAGATTKFGSLTFSTGGHVTISQDSNLALAGTNSATTLALRSSGSIIDQDTAQLSVEHLTSLIASGDIVLGDKGAGNEIDLRVLYARGANISIVESSNYTSANSSDTALLVVDGTKATGTLALKTGGHILQVNDFRAGAPATNSISANQALLVAEGGILLTHANFNRLAAQSGLTGATADTALHVTPGVAFDLGIGATKAISDADGFGGLLTTDVVSSLLPDDPNHAFASKAPVIGTQFTAGPGEFYSIAVTNYGTMAVGRVTDAVGGVGAVGGLVTQGDVTGHVFVETKSGGNLNFVGQGGGSIVVDTANAQIFTALAGGNLTIDGNARLVTRASTLQILGAIDRVYQFAEQANAGPNPEIPPPFGVIDPVSFGPTYIRVIGESNPAVINPPTTLFVTFNDVQQPIGQITITQLGTGADQNLQMTIDWADGTPEELFQFGSPILGQAFAHAFDPVFAASNNSVDVLVRTYNDSRINLFQQVDSLVSFQDMNVVTDTVRMIFGSVPPAPPILPDFVPPTSPVIVLPVISTIEATIPAVFTEFADEGQAVTPIEGVSIQEVDPNDTDIALGDEIQLGKDFLTVDAVKEYIQGEERFRPGLYRIIILYPGADQPEVHYFQKQIRATTIDIFGQVTPNGEVQSDPMNGTNGDIAGADLAKADLSAEEVWRREYEKWFPQVSVQAVDPQADPLQQGPLQHGVDPDLQGVRPPEEDPDHSDLAYMTGLGNWLAEYRQGRVSLELAASGTLVGGALMMAAASRGANPSSNPNQNPGQYSGQNSNQARRRLLEQALANEQEELTSPRISRLRRKIRRIL